MVIRQPSNRSGQDHPGALPTKKLVAAGRTVDEVSRTWEQYRATVNFRQAIDLDYDNHTINYIAHIDRLPDTDDLERRLRGCVADTRSALDNLIFGVGRTREVSEKALKNNVFPIVTERTKWKEARRKLTELPPEIVQRVEAVQPFAQHFTPGPPHPLQVVRDLSNADKHRDSFSLRLIPFIPPGEHLLTTTAITVSIERKDELEQSMHDALNADKLIDLDLSPIVDGAVITRIRLPEWVDLNQVDIGVLDLRLTLAYIVTHPQGYQPAIPTLRAAIRFSRAVVRYVTGVTEQVPQPRDPAQARSL